MRVTKVTNPKPKFSRPEQRKLHEVFSNLRDELKANLAANNSPYDNNLGCGNCGDTGPFHSLLYRLEVEVGMRKVCGCNSLSKYLCPEHYQKQLKAWRKRRDKKVL